MHPGRLKLRTTTSNEFFYYDDKLSGDADFTDNAYFSVEQRKKFLSWCADAMGKCYGVSEKTGKVINPDETDDLLKKLMKNRAQTGLSKQMKFSHMEAYLQERESLYDGWELYTDAACIEGDALLFKRKDIPPTPSAVYLFPEKSRLHEFTFSFQMDGAYKAKIPGNILDVTPGRTIELRSGIHDVIKLQFYANGICCARLGNACPYHLKNIPLGTYDFDVPQRVKIELSGESFSISLNGNTTKNLPLSCGENPDLLYFGCGMFHVGAWKIIPEEMIFEKKRVCSFFGQHMKKNKGTEEKRKKILGSVKLPFAVGGFANRNKLLILEKKFNAGDGKRAELYIETLDPGGRIFLNDRLLIQTDSFESMCLDITEMLKKKGNYLRIEVEPRAPENFFSWHRHEDPYNGWFCGEVSVVFFHEIKISQVEALTLSVNKGRIVCRVGAYVSSDCDINVYLREIYPQKEETERWIGGGKSREGVFKELLEFCGEEWTPDTPNLYQLRLEAVKADGKAIDDAVIETGFRTICQKEGNLYLNGNPLVLTGALLMQFLPPHGETPVTHICSRSEQILWQELMLKQMKGNTLRMHILGYGSNDKRFAEIADRLGIMLIWTTRYIDSVEQLMWSEDWASGDGYLRQLRERINHPSIIMWEGANEYHPSLKDIDKIFDNFVPAIKTVDPTRLICPVSHLYYAGDMLPLEGCAFYNDAGTSDQDGNPAAASKWWNDGQVVRSAHTYEILLGYGTDWKKMMGQEWSMQKELLESKDHAYIVSEFAVIGRQNPGVLEAREYFLPYSYELENEDVLGFRFTEGEWRLSQTYQALAAKADVQILRLSHVDGMLWCCLMGGANDGGYLKPPIDFYGYPKLAFYVLRESFEKLYACSADVNIVKGKGFCIKPVIFGTDKDHRYLLYISITDNEGKISAEHMFPWVEGDETRTDFPIWNPQLKKKGCYRLCYHITAE